MHFYVRVYERCKEKYKRTDQISTTVKFSHTIQSHQSNKPYKVVRIIIFVNQHFLIIVN